MNVTFRRKQRNHNSDRFQHQEQRLNPLNESEIARTGIARIDCNTHLMMWFDARKREFHFYHERIVISRAKDFARTHQRQRIIVITLLCKKATTSSNTALDTTSCWFGHQFQGKKQRRWETPIRRMETEKKLQSLIAWRSSPFYLLIWCSGAITTQ